MCTEIEAKLKVDSLGEIEHKLTGLGAEFQTEQLQIDCFVDDVNSMLTKSDRCLRLRKQMVGKGESFFLAYKGAKENYRYKIAAVEYSDLTNSK
jgi:adenylate cyclase class IV